MAAWMLAALEGYRHLVLVFAGLSVAAFLALLAAGVRHDVSAS